MGEKKPKIGFIGQGFIGKNYADDFENRGFEIVRYALEEEYKNNGDKLQDCEIIFVAVPTPTTPEGFDDSILRSVLAHTPPGSIVVIKSTMLPGTSESIQDQYSDRIILHSPEFLTEATAAHDAAHPSRNIVGITRDTKEHKEAAELVLSVLPDSPYQSVCRAREAEYIKYGGNNWFYFKIVFINLLYDLAKQDGCDWEVIRGGMSADPRVGKSHLMPVHESGTIGSDNFEAAQKSSQKGGRGAGGHCFIKDFAAFSKLYREVFPDDQKGISVLRALEGKNIDLLVSSNKDLDLLMGVYGEDPQSACDC